MKAITRRHGWIILVTTLCVLRVLVLFAASPAQKLNSKVWTFDRLDRIGGFPTTVLGHPRLINTPLGKAVEFNGVDDALFIENHPLAAWYHVAMVYDGKELKSYVNGALEGTGPLQFSPQGAGHSSVGVRINRMYYFKGAVRQARFTPRALPPREFMKLPSAVH